MSVETAPQRPNEATRGWVQSLGDITAPPPDPDEGAGEGGPPAAQPPAAQPPTAPTAAPPEAAKETAATAAAKEADVIKEATASKAKEAPPGDKWPRTSQEWSNFKAARDEGFKIRDAKIQELEKLTEELRSKPVAAVDVKEVESIKAERDELSKQLQAFAVQNHPKFVAYFKNKVGAQVALAKNVVGQQGADVITKILEHPDPEQRMIQLEEFSADLPRFKQLQLASVLNALTQIEAERQEEISKSSQTYEEMRASEQKAASERLSGLEKLFASEVQKLQGKEGNPLFQLREGDDAWNNAVKHRIDSAKALLFGSNQNPQTLVTAAMNAMAYEPLLKSLRAQLDTVSKLQEQIAQLTKANPSIEPGRTEAEGGQARTEDPKPGSRPMEVASRWMKGLPKLGGGM